MTMTLQPFNRISGRDRLPDDAFREAVIEACRAILSTGQYPSYLALRKRGIHGANSRIIRTRDEVLPELGVAPADPRKPKPRGLAAQRAYVMGWQRRPLPEQPKPKEDEPDDEGPCWRERRAFWSTETGKRTRALLRRSTCQSCT